MTAYNVTFKVDSADLEAIQYYSSNSADWYLTWFPDDPNIWEQTLTTATTTGPYAIFEFIGTGVQVVGSVLPGGANITQPVTKYTINDNPAFTYVAQNFTSQMDHIVFFDSGILDNDTHALRIDMVNVTYENQFMLDYIQYTSQLLVPIATPSSSSSFAPSISSSYSHSFSSSSPRSSTSSTPTSSSASSTPTSSWTPSDNKDAYPTGSATSVPSYSSPTTASPYSLSIPVSSSTSSLPDASKSPVIYIATPTPMGPILGGVFGAVAGVATIVVAAFFWFRHRKSPRKDYHYQHPVYPYNPYEESEANAGTQSRDLSYATHSAAGDYTVLPDSGYTPEASLSALTAAVSAMVQAMSNSTGAISEMQQIETRPDSLRRGSQMSAMASRTSFPPADPSGTPQSGYVRLPSNQNIDHRIADDMQAPMLDAKTSSDAPPVYTV